MSKLIHEQDGTIIAYLTEKFKLTTKEKAVWVKVIRADQSVIFGRIVKKST